MILFVAERKQIYNSDIKTLPPLDIKWSAPKYYRNTAIIVITL